MEIEEAIACEEWCRTQPRAAMQRIAELEAILRDVLAVWEPTRNDYRSDSKGDRQYAQARAVWQSAHNASQAKR